MAVKTALTTIALVGLGAMSFPEPSQAETRLLQHAADVPGLAVASPKSPCCSLEDMASLGEGDRLPAAPNGRDFAAQIPLSPDASAANSKLVNGADTSVANAQADAATANLVGATIADVPQSGWNRMLQAVIDLGASVTAKR
jgi:hypothetical protein